jgi:hypothetical protein
MSSIVISGDTSGAITLAAPAVSGTNTLTLPAVTGNILTNKSAGTVLQVLSTTKVNAFTTTSSSPVDVTGLSVSITPTSATSKILVLAQIYGSSDFASGLYVNLVRNSTNLNVSTAGSGVGNSTVGSYFASGALWSTFPIMFLDSPATTSSTTYKIQLFNSGSGTLAVNRRADDAVVGGSSTITVMEIAA